MSKHEELIATLRANAAFLPSVHAAEQYERAAQALEAQAREIEATERQVEILTDALAESRREGNGWRKDAERWRWATEQAEFYSMVVDGTGLLCATLPEAEAAIDAAKGAPHG